MCRNITSDASPVTQNNSSGCQLPGNNVCPDQRHANDHPFLGPHQHSVESTLPHFPVNCSSSSINHRIHCTTPQLCPQYHPNTSSVLFLSCLLERVCCEHTLSPGSLVFVRTETALTGKQSSHETRGNRVQESFRELMEERTVTL